MQKNNQSGRSMVEMLGVLAIIGVLSVGGIAGYSKAMAKFKLSKAMDQVSTVITNVRTLYSGQPNYSGLNFSAIPLGVFPTEMLNGKSANSASVAYNAFNGMAYTSAVASDEKTFTVVFTGLGKEACVALSTADWGSGSGSGLIGVAVSGSIVNGWAGNDIPTDYAGLTSSGTLPLSLTTAAAGCSGVGDTNTVYWKYY